MIGAYADNFDVIKISGFHADTAEKVSAYFLHVSVYSDTLSNQN